MESSRRLSGSVFTRKVAYRSMVSDLILSKSPEDEEFERKLAELTDLEANLVQRELDLMTFQTELNRFGCDYLQLIGSRYTELERVEAQIIEYMEYLESSRDFKPSDSLKKLYREVAKRIHPDLATDEAEKARRQELMIAVNEAYETGDEERLREILQEWESSPESVKGEGVGVELIRVIRKIAQCRARLQMIEREIEELMQTDLGQLKNKVDEAKGFGIDLLAETAKQLDEQIAVARRKLEDLKSGKYSETDLHINNQDTIIPENDINFVKKYDEEKTSIKTQIIDVISLCHEGLIEYTNGNRNIALNIFTRSIEIDSDYTLAYKFRGLVYYKNKEYLNAISDFNRYILEERLDSCAFKFRAFAYYKLGFLDIAIDDLKEVKSLYLIEDNTKSLEMINQLIDDYQKSKEVTNQINFSGYTRLNQTYIEKLDENFPELVQALIMLGDLDFKSGYYQTAIEHYTDALNLDEGNYQAYTNRCLARLKAGAYQEALDDINERNIRGRK
jgi:tetratricopeptide (TPR) repeat protein